VTRSAWWGGVAVAVLLAGAVPATAQPAAPAACEVATDPEYGRTPAKAVEVGGSPLFGGARQKRYLDSLRGPAGQPVTYTRLPAVDAPDGETLIDRYEVTYPGSASPEILHLDWYRYTELRAPAGFVCGQPFELGLPPPDPFQAADQIARLALIDGVSPTPLAPIPLGGEGPGGIGLGLDHLRMLSLAARQSAAGGAPLSADSLPEALRQPRSVVLAYPLRCSDRVLSPAAIVLEDPRGRQAEPVLRHERAEAIARALPGLAAPAGSVAVVFGIDGIRSGYAVKVVFAEDCARSGARSEVTVALDGSSARLLESPMPTRPLGDAAIGSWVAIQALVAPDGRFREVVALGGRADLAQAAVAALEQWRAEPPRLFGAAMVAPVVLRVTFGLR
jgi:hypothetical protein